MRDYPFFKAAELSCKCHECDGGSMDEGFMGCLIAMRNGAQFPFHISSGYRCPDHNERVSNTGRIGVHTTGCAVDIRCYGVRAMRVLELALKHGMTGIGVSQKGDTASRFIHVDYIVADRFIPRPALWSYD